MKKIFYVLMLSAAVSPLVAQGQQKVNTAVPKKAQAEDPAREKRAQVETAAVREMMARKFLMPDQVRALAVQLKFALAQAMRAQEQFQSERMGASDERMQDLSNNLASAGRQFLQMQSSLAYFCRELRRPRADGFLGVTLADTATYLVKGGDDPYVEKFARAPHIGDVWSGTPAEKAGIRPGDLWTMIDGKPLVGQPVDDVFSVLKPGARVEIRIVREGREFDKPVIVEKSPAYPSDVCDQFTNANVFTFKIDGAPSTITMQPMPGAPARAAPRPERIPGEFPGQLVLSNVFARMNGASFRPLTPDKRELLKVPGEDGVVVDVVEDGSPARAAGLRELDVILRANGERIGSVQDLFKVLRAGKTIELTVFRNGETRSVKFSQ